MTNYRAALESLWNTWVTAAIWVLKKTQTMDTSANYSELFSTNLASNMITSLIGSAFHNWRKMLKGKLIIILQSPPPPPLPNSCSTKSCSVNKILCPHRLPLLLQMEEIYISVEKNTHHNFVFIQSTFFVFLNAIV